MSQCSVAQPSSSTRARAFGWLTSVIAGSMALFSLVYWFTVHTVAGRQLADVAIRGATSVGSSAAGLVNRTLDVVTGSALIAAIAVIAVVGLIRMRRAHGLVAIGVLLAANGSGRLLKAFALPRSDLGLNESAPATLNSLPSGHTTAAFSIGVALLFVVPPALRSITASAGIVFSSAVAVATLSAGWHRVGDSLASFLLVTAWAGLAGIVVLLAEHDFSPADRSHRGRLGTGRWWSATAVGLGLITATLLAVLLADPDVRTSTLGPPLAFVTGGLLIVGVAAATTVVVLRVVARVTDDSADAVAGGSRLNRTAVPPPAAAD